MNMKVETILNIIKEHQEEIKKSMDFNLEQFDKMPDFKEYYQKEYLICYYQNVLLNEIKKEILENIK